MAKLPGWLVIDRMEPGLDSEGRAVMLVTMRVRRWHPGYWLELLRFIWIVRRLIRQRGGKQ